MNNLTKKLLSLASSLLIAGCSAYSYSADCLTKQNKNQIMKVCMANTARSIANVYLQEYDSSGKLKLVHYDFEGDGKYDYSESYKYDNKGRKIWTGIDENNDEKIETEIFENYDVLGNLVEEKTMKGSTCVNLERYRYYLTGDRMETQQDYNCDKKTDRVIPALEYISPQTIKIPGAQSTEAPAPAVMSAPAPSPATTPVYNIRPQPRNPISSPDIGNTGY